MAKNVPTNTVVIGKKSFEIRFDVPSKAAIINTIRNISGGNYFKSFEMLITPSYSELEIISIVTGGIGAVDRLNKNPNAPSGSEIAAQVEDAWNEFKDDLRAFAEGLPTDEEAIKYVNDEKQKIADQIANAVRYDEALPRMKPKGMSAQIAKDVGIPGQ